MKQFTIEPLHNFYTFNSADLPLHALPLWSYSGKKFLMEIYIMADRSTVIGFEP